MYMSLTIGCTLTVAKTAIAGIIVSSLSMLEREIKACWIYQEFQEIRFLKEEAHSTRLAIHLFSHAKVSKIIWISKLKKWLCTEVGVKENSQMKQRWYMNSDCSEH